MLQQKHSRFGQLSTGIFHGSHADAISNSSSDSLRLRLENVGVDIIVQLTGEIPKKHEGLFFPQPTVHLYADVVERIRILPGVGRNTVAVFYVTYLQVNFSQFWAFTLEVLQKSLV